MNILKSKVFWVIFSVIALVLIFFAVAPKPIDMNLEKIGNGQKSVVFIYDPNLAVSNQQAIEMNKARELIGEKAILLIADIGDPNSENFRKQYQARAAELLFFDKAGELLDRKTAVIYAGDLTRKLLE